MNAEMSPRFYGRRKGRPLSQSRQRLLDELLPHYQIQPEQLQDYADRQVILEIGFGGGEHLAHIASLNPDTVHIGAEPFINGVASLLQHMQQQQLENIRLWPDDVRLLLNAMPEQFLQGCYILFPDPWPKNRHGGRRIVNPEMLESLSRIIRPGGFLRMASDHPTAQTWLLYEALRHPAFSWTANCAADFNQRPEQWPETRYMAKGVREGRPSVWLDFRRSEAG